MASAVASRHSSPAESWMCSTDGRRNASEEIIVPAQRNSGWSGRDSSYSPIRLGESVLCVLERGFVADSGEPTSLFLVSTIALGWSLEAKAPIAVPIVLNLFIGLGTGFLTTSNFHDISDHGRELIQSQRRSTRSIFSRAKVVP